MDYKKLWMDLMNYLETTAEKVSKKKLLEKMQDAELKDLREHNE